MILDIGFISGLEIGENAFQFDEPPVDFLNQTMQIILSWNDLNTDFWKGIGDLIKSNDLSN